MLNGGWQVENHHHFEEANGAVRIENSSLFDERERADAQRVCVLVKRFCEFAFFEINIPG